MLKLYLSNLKHEVEDAWNEAKQDYEIKSDLMEDVENLDNDFNKIKRKLKRYILNVVKNKELDIKEKGKK
jgi:hypothetical protein